MIVKAGYRTSYSFVHNKNTGTFICFLKKNPKEYFYFIEVLCIQAKNGFKMIIYTFTGKLLFKNCFKQFLNQNEQSFKFIKLLYFSSCNVLGFVVHYIDIY